jgi:ATP-dependent helicase/nuclease subunit B
MTGKLPIDVPGGFLLTGRADRIERRTDGSLAILDYKTGKPPSQTAVETGAAPQLPLEAAMAAKAAFGPSWQGPVAELTYWHVTGGKEPGEASTLFKADAARIAEAAEGALDRLAARVIAFDDPRQPYLAQPHPGLRPRFPKYAQLARVDEWDQSDQDGAGDA